MKKNLLLLSLITLVSFSCSKSDNNPDPGCQLTSANIAGSYKLTSLKYKISSTAPETDVYTVFLEDCQRDDIYVLNANGTVNYNDVGTVCTPSGSTSGVWTLSGTTLTIDGEAFTVANYNCSTITGTQSGVNLSGDLLTATFTRQ
jgi:hypothetical protein